MIAFAFFAALAGLTVLYILFLHRMIEGIRYVASTKNKSANILRDVDDASLPRVTVIVPVRNESANIESCLRSLTAQNYPRDKYQIIVVDDASEDDTMKIAGQIAARDSIVMLLFIRENLTGRRGKKKLITYAISHSNGEVILTTDADCTHHPLWVRSMAAQFRDDVSFVSAPVVYRDRPTLFQRIQALEFLGLVGIGAGFIGIGYPHLCNGANIAYRKSAFDEVDGYDDHDQSSSGDDEFLMQKISSLMNGVIFNACPEGIVETKAAFSLKEFFQQRKRWASKGIRYADKRFVVFLTALFFYFFLLLMSPICFFDSGSASLIVTIFILIKWTFDLSVIIATSKLVHAPFRLFDFFIAELLHVPYIFITALLGTLTSFTWKNRTLKK